MRKLYRSGISDIDDGDQAGARGKDGVYGVFQAQTLVKFWNGSRFEIKCEKVRKLFDTERARSHRDAL
jgi:hypothetical protein